MKAIKHIVAKAISVVVVAVCVAGCTTSAKDVPAPVPAGWPPGWDHFSFVWTAEPGIDVTDQPIAAVRAYVESYQLANLLGDDKYLYPGFADALDPDQATGPSWARELRPSTNQPARSPWIGAERNHVLSIVPMDGGAIVVVCQYTYAVGALPRVGTRYEPQDGGPKDDATGGITELLVTVKTPTSPAAPKAPQQGPARTPSNDVFDGYRIVQASGGYFWDNAMLSGWPGRDAAEASCLAKAPEPVQWRNQFTANYHQIDDFPVLPPTPGWPAKPAS